MTVILHHRPGVHDVGAAALALGVFDGVHTGHQALITDMIARAAEHGVASCVLTFDRDPDQVVTPESAAPQLTTLDDKLTFIAELGPDAVLVVPFDERLAGMSPERFLHDVVLDACRPTVCVVGIDFRFGSRAAGDIGTLRSFGAVHDFTVLGHELIAEGGAPVTSSRIRRLVSDGQVAAAARLLGRPHRLRGTVVHGRGLGREIGAPTANLDVDPRFALPAAGVYAAWADTHAGRFAAAVSVGVPPTFPDATCVLEAFLLDFHGDLYGTGIVLEFVEHIREQRPFPDTASLASAIAADGQTARQILGD